MCGGIIHPGADEPVTTSFDDQQRAQRRDLAVERQIEISHGAVRHADAEPVVADQCVVFCTPSQNRRTPGLCQSSSR